MALAVRRVSSIRRLSERLYSQHNARPILSIPAATDIYPFGAPSETTIPLIRFQDQGWNVHEGEAWAVVSNTAGAGGKGAIFKVLQRFSAVYASHRPTYVIDSPRTNAHITPQSNCQENLDRTGRIVSISLRDRQVHRRVRTHLARLFPSKDKWKQRRGVLRLHRSLRCPLGKGGKDHSPRNTFFNQ